MASVSGFFHLAWCFLFFFLATPHGLWDLSSPNQGLIPGPWQWKRRVLTIGLPGNSQHNVFKVHPCCSMNQNFIPFYGWIIFHCWVSQGNRNKNKNKQMEPNQTYELLHSKGNHKQNKKTTYGLGENICKWCNWQGLNFQNIQIAHTTW